MNMVDCNAEWLYTLPQWDKILTPERRKELYKIQKSSKTIVKPPKELDVTIHVLAEAERSIRSAVERMHNMKLNEAQSKAVFMWMDL